MKNKEEPSRGSMRGNPSSPEETTGSLSRPGRTATAPCDPPALSLFFETLMEPTVADSNGRSRSFPNAFAHELKLVRRTAVCGSACTVVWGPGGETRPATRFVMAL